MSRTKEKVEPYVYEYTKELKLEIKRVNQVLRETHNPHEYRQNKRHLERLERKLRKL